MTDIEEIQHARIIFLKRLYDKRNCDSLGIPDLDVGRELGFEDVKTKSIADDLANNLFIEYTANTFNNNGIRNGPNRESVFRRK